MTSVEGMDIAGRTYVFRAPQNVFDKPNGLESVETEIVINDDS
jgi:hypothetical protein